MSEQFQCRFCQKSYKEVLGFLDHFETHMNKKDVTQQEQQNSNHFEDNEKHNQKIQTQGPSSIKETTNINLENEDIRSCEMDLISEEKFSSSRLNQSCKRRENVCETCDNKFSSYRTLNFHIQNVHNKVKSLKCDLCFKTFGINSDVIIHMKTVHENKKVHKCETCGKIFPRKMNLDVHMKIVHEKIKNYKCEACGIFFGEKSNLMRHVKTAHENRKTFKCDLCSKCFGQKQHMNFRGIH